MTTYKQKYLKYKLKYNSIKNKNYIMTGGSNLASIDIDENNVISQIINTYSTSNKNLGQNNCGITFIDKYAIKCSAIVSEDYKNKYNNNDDNKKQHELNNVKLINEELDGLFSKFYAWKNGDFYNFIKVENDKYAMCYIMEKLDGDLTDYILKQSYFTTFNNYNNYDFYYDRLPKTNNDGIQPNDDNEENILNFDSMLNKIRPFIIRLCQDLNDKVIFLHHKCLQAGWDYGDLKFDNIGYKIINNEIKLYFIDKESGLSKIKDDSFMNYVCLHSLNSPLSEYSILGQYNLSSIFNVECITYSPIFVKYNIIKYLQKNDFGIK